MMVEVVTPRLLHVGKMVRDGQTRFCFECVLAHAPTDTGSVQCSWLKETNDGMSFRASKDIYNFFALNTHVGDGTGLTAVSFRCAGALWVARDVGSRFRLGSLALVVTRRTANCCVPPCRSNSLPWIPVKRPLWKSTQRQRASTFSLTKDPQ